MLLFSLISCGKKGKIYSYALFATATLKKQIPTATIESEWVYASTFARRNGSLANIANEHLKNIREKIPAPKANLKSKVIVEDVEIFET